MLERALQVLRAEYRIAGRENLYVALKPFLQSTGAAGDYAAPAAELGMSEGAVRTAVHRLRSKYRDVLRATVADTLNDPAMVDEELRVLIAALT